MINKVLKSNAIISKSKENPCGLIHTKKRGKTPHKKIKGRKQTSLEVSSDAYGRTKLTVILEGIVDGVGGRGFIKADGVLGGSMFGATFFHDSINAESWTGVSGKFVDMGRAPITLIGC